MFVCFFVVVPITSYSTCGFIIFDCDYGIVLIKEPTVERKPSPEAPKQSVAPVERKILPLSEGIQSHTVVELFLVCLLVCGMCLLVLLV